MLVTFIYSSALVLVFTPGIVHLAFTSGLVFIFLALCPGNLLVPFINVSVFRFGLPAFLTFEALVN